MWIASKPNAFAITFLIALIAGFFLGVHAVTASGRLLAALVAFAGLGAVLGFAAGRGIGRGPSSPPSASSVAPAASPRLADAD